MSPDASQLIYRRLTPADRPALARLLAASFKGKFALALGRDEAHRAQRIEALLPGGIICPGIVYVITRQGELAGTFTIRTAATSPDPQAYRQAQVSLQDLPGPARIGALHAWWAVTVFRQMGGPRVATGEGYVDNLAIDPALRGQGIATNLIPFVYEESRALGLHTLIADVMSSNQRVIALYQRAGWEITGRNYWIAPLAWPLFGTPGILHIRKVIDEAAND